MTHYTVNSSMLFTELPLVAARIALADSQAYAEAR